MSVLNSLKYGDTRGVEHMTLDHLKIIVIFNSDNDDDGGNDNNNFTSNQSINQSNFI